MKKALAILLALSMVFAAFADEPATNYSVAEFSGEASLEYVYDLENEESGFVNSANANLKINLLNGGNKATTGDGIWGELEIKIDTPDALTNPGDLSIRKTASVEKAIIHFVEGDFGVALNLKKPGLSLGDVVLPTAASGETKSAKFDFISDYSDKIEAVEKMVDKFKADIEEITDEDEKAAMTEMLNEVKAELAATKAAALDAGFAVEFTSPKVDATIKVLDNGVAANDSKEYGFGADVSVKAIENAGLKAAFAYAYETTAFGVSADYKYAIDDTMYVKPVIAFGMSDADEDIADKKELAAGVLFGWGADGQKPEFALLNKDSGKFADGVSVTYKTDLAEEATQEIVIGAYDSTLVEGLKVGAEYKTKLDDFGKGTLATGVKYSTDIDIFTLSGEFGYTNNLLKEADNYIYSAEVKTDDIIDNTTVYGKYEGGKDNKGKITVGAKIAL